MKLFKISFRINPLAETSRETKKALENDPKCRPLVLAYYYEDSVELNERKWDDKELFEALTAFVRYDLQVLSVALADAVKNSQKKGEPLSELVKDVIADFKQKLDKKISRGLDELKGDGGANKATAKSMTDALKKIAADVSEDAITKAADALKSFVETFAKAIGDEEVTLDRLVSSKAIREYEKIMAAFTKSTKAADQSIQGVISAVKQIKNKKDLEARIVAIIESVKSDVSTFEDYLSEYKEFEREAGAIKSELGNKTVSAKNLHDIIKDLDKLKGADKKAKDIRTKSANARRQLKQAMTDLKLK
ncbi:hypothetical protein [Paragemmobacter straminiformis]|uniref:Uncharacterized protein n=1 Tax=Paragemmobacter straminiformis TaxID=2045119 RepID=A0A842IA22_9RHOB|nr:hypothetical protein [Gemmobacter straminiformis]MBC2836441.1 hypothetical protein [Gemmobacter straminiformis]